MAARRKAPLRAVTPDETAPRSKKKQTVSEAAASGDHRALLVSMRERIAKTVSNADCPPRDLAALTRRLQEIAKEIAALDVAAAEEAASSESATEDEDFDASAI